MSVIPGCGKKVSVPFGDVYGGIHVSEMPPYKKSRYSKKYGVCGALEKDDAAIESCLPTLQKLLRRDDAEALADMMIYPIPVNIGFSLTFIKNREEFVKFYPRLFTPTRKREILKLPVTDIFCNYKGLMLDRGLWFTIATDGSVTDVHVVRNVDERLDNEAVRVISSSPKWTPGQVKGKPVPVRFYFPVVFKASGEETPAKAE